MYLQPRTLEARATCRDYYGNYYTCNNSFYSWGRWVIFGVVVLGALLLFFLFSCISARRRRKRGFAPFRGTGWAVGQTAAGHGQPQYNGQVQPQYEFNNTQQQQPHYGNNDPTQQPYYSSNAPPAYGQNAAHGGANGGYSGGQGDVQQPGQVYTGQYKPPAGPPPGR